MTNQDKIKWLKQYKHLDSSIKRLIDEKERYKSIALKVTPTWSDMPKGSDGENPRELALCEMMDCEVEINKLISELHNLRQDIRKFILKTGINDSDLLKILSIEK